MKILLVAFITIVAFVLGVFNFNKGVSEAQFLSRIAASVTSPIVQLKGGINPQLRLDAPGEELADKIILNCNLSFLQKLQQVTADASYSRALSAVKVPGGLTLDDMNTIFGSPVSAKSPASVDICMTSLAALYTHYPDHWTYLESTSNGELAELTERFRQAQT